MIELDYNDSTALAKFVDLSGYFSKSVETLRNEYNSSRPIVTGIKQLKNYATDVSPSITQLTIEFSSPMNKKRTGFELGSSGESKALYVKNMVGFSEDGKSVTVEVALLPGKEYEVFVADRFTSTNSIALIPYLIKFKTAEK